MKVSPRQQPAHNPPCRATTVPQTRQRGGSSVSINSPPARAKAPDHVSRPVMTLSFYGRCISRSKISRVKSRSAMKMTGAVMNRMAMVAAIFRFCWMVAS